MSFYYSIAPTLSTSPWRNAKYRSLQVLTFNQTPDAASRVHLDQGHVRQVETFGTMPIVKHKVFHSHPTIGFQIFKFLCRFPRTFGRELVVLDQIKYNCAREARKLDTGKKVIFHYPSNLSWSTQTGYFISFLLQICGHFTTYACISLQITCMWTFQNPVFNSSLCIFKSLWRKIGQITDWSMMKTFWLYYLL